MDGVDVKAVERLVLEFRDNRLDEDTMFEALLQLGMHEDSASVVVAMAADPGDEELEV